MISQCDKHSVFLLNIEVRCLVCTVVLPDNCLACIGVVTGSHQLRLRAIVRDRFLRKKGAANQTVNHVHIEISFDELISIFSLVLC